MTQGIHPDIPKEVVEGVDNMLNACLRAYLQVASSLREGMTEHETASLVVEELKGGQVTDFWYDIPVLVLFGTKRFLQMVEPDYAVKRPSVDVKLKPSDPFFIDMHPRHKGGQWGNFAATGLFRSANQAEFEFLNLVQAIQQEGIETITAETTGRDLAQWFDNAFMQRDIELLDVRGNYGHSMGQGAKAHYRRLFLDNSNSMPMAGGIYGIEPGGIQRLPDGKVLVARFEDCVYVSALSGRAQLLGRTEALPIAFG